MTPEQFAYWLQGYAEINQKAPTEEQWQIIQDHLKLVFTKVTPDYHTIQPVIRPSTEPIYPKWPYEVTCSSGHIAASEHQLSYC